MALGMYWRISSEALARERIKERRESHTKASNEVFAGIFRLLVLLTIIII